MHAAKKTKSDISLVKDILNFSDESIIDKALAIKKEYLSFTYQNLLVLINKAIEENSQFAVIKSALDSMSEKELDVFLFTPELANKLYRRQDMTVIQKANYLLRIIDGEVARKEKKFDHTKYPELWTADGAQLFQYDNENDEFAVYTAPALMDSIILDFFSPYNRLISNRDCNVADNYEVDMYSFEISATIADRMDQCIKRTDPAVQQFIKHFTAVMIFKKFKGATKNETLLFSATDGAFISRVIFGNVVNYYDEELIDAIVHESIHGLLFMIDELTQWMPGTILSDKIGRIIVSPWTGNKLTLRNVLQAVFVWYGLYNFWKHHQTFSNSPFITQRLDKIRQGFQELDISVYGKEVPARTIETIAAIKTAVLA